MLVTSSEPVLIHRFFNLSRHFNLCQLTMQYFQFFKLLLQTIHLIIHLKCAVLMTTRLITLLFFRCLLVWWISAFSGDNSSQFSTQNADSGRLYMSRDNSAVECTFAGMTTAIKGSYNSFPVHGWWLSGRTHLQHTTIKC